MKQDKESRNKGKALGMKRSPYVVFFNDKGKKIWAQAVSLSSMMYKSDIEGIFKRYSVKLQEK